MFQPGDLVLCVNDDERAYARPDRNYAGTLDGLTKGSVYTVRDVFLLHPQYDHPLVRLVELSRPTNQNMGMEGGYNPARFRPLLKLEIESFVSEGELV